MRVNVDKVLDRDIKLGEMDSKAKELEIDASVFKTSAGKLKRKYWWKNCKVSPANPLMSLPMRPDLFPVSLGCIGVKLRFIRRLHFVHLGQLHV